MYGPWSAAMWGAPVGLGIFMPCLGVGMGVFFWGVSTLPARKYQRRQGVETVV